MPKLYEKHLEDTHAGHDCVCTASYKNALYGRAPTPFADYAALLRRQSPRNYGIARLIEIFHGEQRRFEFFDFFTAAAKLYRIDERTTEPLEGWRLDQDRSIKNDLWMYDAGGWVK